MIQLLKMDFIIDACENYLRFYGQQNKPPPHPLLSNKPSSIYIKYFIQNVQSFCISFKGFVTDGEFNSLPTQGKDRPVSIIQLIMDAKNEARAIPAKEIEKFFKSVKKGNYTVVLLLYHTCNVIPCEICTVYSYFN